MKIILKNLKQIEYELQIPSNSISVKELKLIIEDVYSFDSDEIKLISNGTVLEDSKKLSEYNINEGSTIIIMKVKIKNRKKNPNNNNINTSPKTDDKNNNNIEIKKGQNNQDISQILKDNLKITIDSLVDMGFEKSQVEIAVKAANGRIDLAIEYLNNGIPDNANKNINNNVNRRNNNENEITRELKKQASIIKVLCKDNKFLIFGILENIKRNDPGLLRLITDYRDEFRKYLDTPITEEDEKNYKNIETKADEIINKRREEKEKKKKEEENKKNEEKKEDKKDEEIKEDKKNENNPDDKKESKNNDMDIGDKKDEKEKKEEKDESDKDKEAENEKKKIEEEVKEKENKKDENNNNNNNYMQSQLTEDDKEIIKRLQDISGFPYDKIVEAFIVCNKNEELTANYLFEQYK